MSPLAGVRIVVTRAAHQAEDLARPLRELGAEVLLLPMIGIAPPEDISPLQRAAASLDQYDWVIFTSANAVTALQSLMPEHAEEKPKFAAVGAATRRAAESAGFPVTVTPETYVAESLLESLGTEDLRGKRVLIPSSAIARDVVPVELRNRGADVTVVEAYRNVCPSESIETAPRIFRPPYPNWVLFASPSAFENLYQLIGTQSLRQVRIASIGPVTSDAVRGSGLAVTVEADPHTTEGLVEALVQWHGDRTVR